VAPTRRPIDHPCCEEAAPVHPVEACALVLFGALGDMTRRLLTPALYHLAQSGLVPTPFAFIGVDHLERTAHDWSEGLHAFLEALTNGNGEDGSEPGVDAAAWGKLAVAMVYVQGDFEDPALYRAIGEALQAQSQRFGGAVNAVFYLAVPDRFFCPIAHQLAAAGLTRDQKDGARSFWRRVVVEKPFGHDLPSAKTLDANLLSALREDQIFRIDHFLGKETVQSIMALRFANGLFEPIWNRDRIDHVQITAAETVGVETRGSFYEATGALRDMLPNHLFTLLSMVAMEPPVGFDANAIRDKKAEVLAAISSIAPKDVVRGQYDAGSVLGEAALPYRSEAKVAPDSNVETYVAMRLEIDNWRWAGVPFYLRTGKHLSTRLTEIAIRFKQAPHALFQNTSVSCLTPNWLVIHVAPKEGISLQFDVKEPGPEIRLAGVKMEFHYADWFERHANVGYETLLLDVMQGDQTLFMRADMVEQGWRIVQPVLDAWTQDRPQFPNYASGSEGPAAAADLLERQGGRSWRPLTELAGDSK